MIEPHMNKESHDKKALHKKSRLARWFFHLYAERRVRKTFSRVSVRGLDQLRAALALGPVIAAPNHVAFWDVFLLLILEKAASAEGYALMDRDNYERLRFFSWIGALPLDRKRPKAAYRDLRRGIEVLDRPSRLLFVFPQGEQRPAHLPLEFRAGVAVASRLKGAPVVPIALRYEFGEDPKPEVLISIGPALPPRDQDALMVRALTSAVSDELSRIDDELARRQRTFPPLWLPRKQGLPLGSGFLARLARRGA